MKIKSALSVAGLLCLLSYVVPAIASAEAGLDATFKPVRVRVIYSVALNYGEAADCIRDPGCLLFDIIALLQARSLLPKSQQQEEVLQFLLYQSSKKAGNFLAFDRDPFEGEHFKTLYDGSANKDLGRQVISLLERHLKLPRSKKNQKPFIKLYKCTEAKNCSDIMFGSFPSDTMHTGYCATLDKGCDTTFISVRREEMKKIFSSLP